MLVELEGKILSAGPVWPRKEIGKDEIPRE